MIEFIPKQENHWEPPVLTEETILRILAEKLPTDWEKVGSFLVIHQIEPYIDSIYVRYTGRSEIERVYYKRFVIHEDYRWSYDDERLFTDYVLHNQRLDFTPVADEIYRYYAENYPDWKLKRYYTKPMRLLDHIYHCMMKDTAKEILYKAGLDELADHMEDLDEINLLAAKPSDLYDGISMRTLRSLNCRNGSLLLAASERRIFIKELQSKFPDVFQETMNDAQSSYLNYLIEGELTVGEAGRLYLARRMALMMIWTPSQYEMFLWKEKLSTEVKQQAEEISRIDPIYCKYLDKMDGKELMREQRKIELLHNYLIRQREEYNSKFRRSNRKRNSEWQERGEKFIVRYPQTIHDFCREAVYMSNCLLTYVDAYLENDTTILFLRRAEEVNKPYITIEVFNDELMQAYHRYNEDCTPEEAQWIREYCDRHGIRQGRFQFNNGIDELF